MTMWIIAYNKDGNTTTLKHESDHQPDMDEAVDLVMEKAERDYEKQEMEHDPTEENTPALRLAECYGITITGISQA